MAGAITPLSVSVNISPVSRDLPIGGVSALPPRADFQGTVARIRESFKEPAGPMGATIPSAGQDPAAQLGPLSSAEHLLIRQATRGVVPAPQSHMDFLENADEDGRGADRNVAVVVDRGVSRPTQFGVRPSIERTDPPGQMGPLAPVEHRMMEKVTDKLSREVGLDHLVRIRNGDVRFSPTRGPRIGGSSGTGANIDILA